MGKNNFLHTSGVLISGCRSIPELDVSIKNVKRISESLHNRSISKFLSLRSEAQRPNILITIRSRQSGFWYEMSDVSSEDYAELRSKAAKFIRKFLIDVMGEHLKSLSYEEWPQFYAAFEHKTKFHDVCYGHFHILVRVPENKVKDVCDNTAYMYSWLKMTQSEDWQDYDCVPLDKSHARSCGYVHKMSGTDYGLGYSIDNSNIRSILKK